MKSINVEVMQELFDSIGVQVRQLSCSHDENNFRLCGSVSAEQCLEDYLLFVKANLCDEEGNVLYVISEYCGISFEYTKYDGFSIYSTNLSRYFDMDKLHHVEVYPKVEKKNEK